MAAKKGGKSDKAGPPRKAPIVGIGASAGGVRALQGLFDGLPPDLGLSYVVILHLAPEVRSELPKILRTHTRMPVTTVDGTTPLEPDHVYVISPDRALSISDDHISSDRFEEPRGHRLPIDLFFRSLAAHHSDGFAVILSGAGADGALGVRAVKEVGGIVLVQEPREAEYGSMPTAAINTGTVDIVLPVAEIGKRLAELAQLPPPGGAGDKLKDGEEEFIRRILAHVRVRTGHDFSKYKRSTVLRRIQRRAQVARRDSLGDYHAYLRENAEEAQALFADLLISVTAFFRDPHAFETLTTHVIPRLFEGKEAADRIRVWVPGCATGEEAYTLGMLLLEEAARRDLRPELQVFGSDLDGNALTLAREGCYPLAIETDVSEERLRRYFSRDGDQYRVKRELRDIVLFASHSLLRDPPFSRVDLISCRNLLIYLERELQQLVIGTFHYALNPNGFLFLGSSESAEHPGAYFRIIDREAHLYQAVIGRGDKIPPLPRLVTAPVLPNINPPPRAPATSRAPAEGMSHRQALEQVAPPSILVDDSHHAVHLSETAGRYLEPSGGPLSADIIELARPELRLDLRAALFRAFERNESSLSMPILVRFNGEAHRVYLQVRPLRPESDRAPQQALVCFIESEAVDETLETPAVLDDRTGSDTVRRLAEELKLTQTRLRTTREESEAATEELRAANEELQSINEEYRSTSEELETSKEELQSVNEELQTVNNELKLKLEGVSRANSDLQNLMAATDVGTLFLDPALRIKRFTPPLTGLFNITDNDEGRPITDFTHQLDYERLRQDCTAVLRNLTPVEQEVRSREGAWFLMRIRPYRTLDDRIDGVVVTFVDITERRKAELALRQSEERFRQFAEASSDGLWIREAKTLAMEYASPAIETIYGVALNAVLGDEDRWAALILPEDRDTALEHIEMARRGHAVVHEFRIQRPSDGAFRWIRNTDFPLLDESGQVRRIGGIAQDFTETKLSVEHQAVLLAELQHRVRNIMAVIRSIAARTGERAESVAEYSALMDGRLVTLARVQALLTRSGKAVGMGAIVHEELSAQAQQEGQYDISGPDVVLSPKATEVLTLAVHELATNALKYGALSTPQGQVKVRWSMFDKSGTSWLSFDWIEEGAPPSPKAASGQSHRRGFGSELIEGRIPYELKGSGKITIEPGGARCHLEFPLQEGASILETDAPQRALVFGGALDMAGEPNLSGHRILVVEDDYFLASDTARAVRAAGAQVLGPCPSEDAARSEIGEVTPTGAVIDINLGSGPSFELARSLQDRRIPFVFITGYDEDVIPSEFDEVARLQKPVDFRQIVAVLATALDGGRPVEAPAS